jgi:hypothetical protein
MAQVLGGALVNGIPFCLYPEIISTSKWAAMATDQVMYF